MRRQIQAIETLLIVLLIIILQTQVHCIRCYSCASVDYRELWMRFTRIRHSKKQPGIFDHRCDRGDAVRLVAVEQTCASTCVTVFEPKVIGGMVADDRSFTYLRGCSEDIFTLRDRVPRTNGPREVAYLHEKEICLSVPVSEIWPTSPLSSHGLEDVQVCSCKTDYCNNQETISISRGSPSRTLMRDGGGVLLRVGQLTLMLVQTLVVYALTAVVNRHRC